jgi:pimeloyl-ACP methyl ester carboxylesterase
MPLRRLFQGSPRRAFLGSVLAALAVLLVLVDGVAAQSAEMSCQQAPGNRFYWVERAFCDLELNGPAKAQGLIIWNHGISGTLESYKAPAPLAFRLLQARAWDVVMIKRHNQAETMAGGPLYRTVQRTLEEVKTQRKLGYRKIVLAGQSFGGYVTLEAADESPDVFAAVAMAPGVRAGGASGRLDASIVDRLLQSTRAGRIAVVFPKDDAVFGNVVRGENANRILARGGLPYLLLDETSGLTGHGGGVGGRFAVRYGLCLAEFLSAPRLPGGRFTCQPSGDPGPVVRELLLPAAADRPAITSDPAKLPDGLGRLTGLWYALVDETIVLFALVPTDGPKLRVVYRSSSSSRAGSVYDAEIRDGQVHVVLPQKDRITVGPDAEGGIITWTSSDGSRVLKGKLLRAPE